jgi:hypothetical protein
LKPIETNYANTDLNLLSPVAFHALDAELSVSCCQLHYAKIDDGGWSASYEAKQLNTDAPNDIRALLSALDSMSETAKVQLATCSKRDFNIGFNCWDTWAYNYLLPAETLHSVARAGFSISVTMYPMRHPDGTSKIDPDDV